MYLLTSYMAAINCSEKLISLAAYFSYSFFTPVNTHFACIYLHYVCHNLVTYR